MSIYDTEEIAEYLNKQEEENEDFAIDAFVLDNCIEWSNLISELSEKEVALYKWKEVYNIKSEEIIQSTNFKELYGKNNEQIRKEHVKHELSDWYNNITELEFSIDYCKRRLSFLRQLVATKTALLEVKKDE